MRREEVVVATHPDDGQVIGVFGDKDAAKQWVTNEVEHLEAYEADYWEEPVITYPFKKADR